MSSGSSTTSTSAKSDRVLVRLCIGHHSQHLPLGTLPNDHTHRWTVFVRAPGGMNFTDRSFIDKVTFRLHSTFENPERTVKKPPFEVTETGYGGFPLPIDIRFAGVKKTYTINYDLSLSLDAYSEHKIEQILEIKNPPKGFAEIADKYCRKKKTSDASTSSLIQQPKFDKPPLTIAPKHDQPSSNATMVPAKLPKIKMKEPREPSLFEPAANDLPLSVKEIEKSPPSIVNGKSPKSEKSANTEQEEIYAQLFGPDEKSEKKHKKEKKRDKERGSDAESYHKEKKKKKDKKKDKDRDREKSHHDKKEKKKDKEREHSEKKEHDKDKKIKEESAEPPKPKISLKFSLKKPDSKPDPPMDAPRKDIKEEVYKPKEPSVSPPSLPSHSLPSLPSTSSTSSISPPLPKNHLLNPTSHIFPRAESPLDRRKRAVVEADNIRSSSMSPSIERKIPKITNSFVPASSIEISTVHSKSNGVASPKKEIKHESDDPSNSLTSEILSRKFDHLISPIHTSAFASPNLYHDESSRAPSALDNRAPSAQDVSPSASLSRIKRLEKKLSKLNDPQKLYRCAELLIDYNPEKVSISDDGKLECTLNEMPLDVVNNLFKLCRSNGED